MVDIYTKYDTSIYDTLVTVRVTKLPPGEYTPGYITRIFKFGWLVFSPPVCHLFYSTFTINLTSTSFCCDLYLSVNFHTYLFSICFYRTTKNDFIRFNKKKFTMLIQISTVRNEGGLCGKTSVLSPFVSTIFNLL